MTGYFKKYKIPLKFPLVRPLHLNQINDMIWIKNLPFYVISTLVIGSAVTVNAQLSLELSTQKSYRQNQKSVQFESGKFKVDLSDGSLTSVGGCNFIQYYPPGYFTDCFFGTAGYLESGTIPGVTPPERYIAVTSISPATVVEAGAPDRGRLNAAPASTLRRPKAGFRENSAVISYNLNTAFVEKYTITRYNASTSYSKKQRRKFESDIVPGSYQYYFPRLNQPNVPVAIIPFVYPMPEGSVKGISKLNVLRFTTVNKNKWSKDGFMELSYSKPNLFKWTPLAAQALFPSGDTLSFAIRVIKDPKNPNSTIRENDTFNGRVQSVFPDFNNASDPKLYLRNPTTSSFTVPPVFAGGTKGVVELQLQRNVKTSGVTYDNSFRRFQLPVVVVNRYSDYQDLAFPLGKKNTTILDDTDGDGYNNLNEWVLGSAANDPTSKPEAPVTTLHEAIYDSDYFAFYRVRREVIPRYFGFTIDQKLGTDPDIVYTLQRSRDGSKTWLDFPDGYYYADGSYSSTPKDYTRSNNSSAYQIDWVVKTTPYEPGIRSIKSNSPARREIKVRTSTAADVFYGLEYSPNIQPPGTENDTYRVKITLKKK